MCVCVCVCVCMLSFALFFVQMMLVDVFSNTGLLDYASVKVHHNLTLVLWLILIER